MQNTASNAELARLSELIDSIYQGATDPAHWNKVLPAIAEWVDAPRGMLMTPQLAPDNGGFCFLHKTPEHFFQLLATKYVSQGQDIWTTRALERGLLREGNVLIGDEDLISFEELSRTDVYRNVFALFDVAHLLSGVVFDMESPNMPWVACAWSRGVKDPGFTSFERERLRMLIPHISRSLGVMLRLRDRELRIASSLAALDLLNAGVLLFDVRGSVVFANRVARRILEGDDGLRLRHRFGDSSLGEIIAGDNKSQAELAAAIRSAVSPDILGVAHFSHAVMVSRTSGRQEYILNFSSLAAENEFGAGADVPRAIAFITDNAEPIRLDGELLRKTYGLTPAEIRLAELMGESLTVEEAAERLGVSRHTAKTQLQSIYMKTNTNNRAKLMRLIMSLSQFAN
ncbi:MAG TPA: helix-turn-helix transcriptional regulator [Gallionella sp.]|nr:helix-turn-helix transcriptional regulator [Gallionella sp.]